MGDSSQDDPASPDDVSRRVDSRGDRAGSGSRGEGDSLFVGIGAICETATRLTGADGAAVAVLAASGAVRELVYATDPLAQQIDELQFTVGEGPCLDAYHQDRVQLCAELTGAQCAQRWPVFTAELAELGVAAVFAVPVPGALRPMGVMELYRRTSGGLTELEQQSAQLCAATISGALEANWRTHLLQSSSERAAIDAAAVHGAAAAQPADPYTRSQVYVAAGMVAVQLKVSTHDGVDRLRAYAYAQKRSIVAVAADVISRRLSFPDLNGDEARS
jgi:GAF domain